MILSKINMVSKFGVLTSADTTYHSIASTRRRVLILSLIPSLNLQYRIRLGFKLGLFRLRLGFIFDININNERRYVQVGFRLGFKHLNLGFPIEINISYHLGSRLGFVLGIKMIGLKSRQQGR